MFRAFFIAVGIFVCILGLECLVIEKAVFANFATQGQQVDTFGFSAPAPKNRVVVPPDWAPWAFLAGGAVVILYSFTLPRRIQG